MTPEMTVRCEVRLTREEYLAWREQTEGSLLSYKFRNLADLLEREVREQASRCGWDRDCRSVA